VSLRIYIFEEDPSFLKLLTVFLEKKGFSVQGFHDGYSCPLYQLERCVCPADTPCADAVLVNTRIPSLEGIRLLLDQDRKGCKLPRENKGVMSAGFTTEQQQLVQSHGFQVIRKPARLAAISAWLDECARRLGKHLD